MSILEENQGEEALNVPVGDEANSDATPAPEDQAAEEAIEPEAEPTGEAEGEVEETAGEEPKKGSQARIRELNAKAKAAEAKARSLEAKLAELTNPVGFQGVQTPAFDPQEPIIAPGEEIDGAELNRRIGERDKKILQQANANAVLMQKQSEAVARINSEASEAIRNYPELDPEAEDFNQDLSDSITEATEAYVRVNPYTASVKGFVAKLMKPYKGAVEKEVGQASENIARQVSQTALRPTSVRKGEKPASEKSIAELERDLGVVQS